MKELISKNKIVLFQIFCIGLLLVCMNLVGAMGDGMALLSYSILMSALMIVCYSVKSVDDAKGKIGYAVGLTALILVSPTATFLQPYILMLPLCYAIFKVLEAEFANELFDATRNMVLVRINK